MFRHDASSRSFPQLAPRRKLSRVGWLFRRRRQQRAVALPLLDDAPPLLGPGKEAAFFRASTPPSALRLKVSRGTGDARRREAHNTSSFNRLLDAATPAMLEFLATRSLRPKIIRSSHRRFMIISLRRAPTQRFRWPGAFDYRFSRKEH